MKPVQNPLQLLRHQIGKTVLVMVIAFQISNLSIDAVDLHPHQEDLSVNEIESCLELIIEVVMGHENAIEETDDGDHQTNKPGPRVTLFTSTSAQLAPEMAYIWIDNDAICFSVEKFLSIQRTILLPPPKDLLFA